MAQSVRQIPRLLVRVRKTLRGCGEIAGAVGAAAWAIGELCLGRWPQPDRIKPPKATKVAPFPVND